MGMGGTILLLWSLKEGAQTTGGSSELGGPLRTKWGAGGWILWRPLSGVKSASEEDS